MYQRIKFLFERTKHVRKTMQIFFARKASNSALNDMDNNKR